MPFLYNVHTPNKTFALAFKDGEKYDGLIQRIATKASLSVEDLSALRRGKDGAGLVYEYEGGRWSLEDDDDLSILTDRLPPASTSSATLHLTPPHAHAHFDLRSPSIVSRGGGGGLSPPGYTAASALKNKTQRSGSSGVGANGTSGHKSQTSKTGTTASDPASANTKANTAANANGNGNGNGERSSSAAKSATAAPAPPISISAPSHHFPTASHSGNAPEVSALSKPGRGEKVQVVGHTEGKESESHSHSHAHQMLAPPIASDGGGGGRAPSVRSTVSRKSKYGINDAEPLWETKKRAWLEFHNGTGVRTVIGKVGKVENVRMLLKPGYKGVYVSRSFAVKAQLVDKKYAMGSAGYTGLRTLGQVPITVAGRTASHPALISEEAHFDVVLGRQWVERMNVKIDPNDQTILTYMDTGDSIPCDIVVLKDDKGNKIHIT